MKSALHPDEFVLVAPVQSPAVTLKVEWLELPEEWQNLRKELRGRPSDPAARFAGRELELLECTCLGQGKARAKNDAWVMRSEFLRLKQNTDALLKFLNRWGAWNNINDAGTLHYIVPSRIWQFQERCRNALRGPANDWLSAPDLQLFRTRREYPHFCWTIEGCARAILTTITIDFLNKVKFHVCSRRDCQTPFAVENRHKHKYCSQYCGHIESVRRQRRIAKQEGKQAAKGRS